MFDRLSEVELQELQEEFGLDVDLDGMDDADEEFLEALCDGVAVEPLLLPAELL